MASFVYFKRASPQEVMGYKIAHSLIASRRSNLERVVFAAFVKNSNESVELPTEFNGVKTEQRMIGSLELSIAHSDFTHYETLAASRSPESKAQYAGHILKQAEEFGMLLQYLPAGATTTAHLHTHREGYFIIYGRAFAYPLDGNAQHGEAVTEFRLGWRVRSREKDLSHALIVPGNTWHPLKGVEDSLIVIVAHRNIVEDQVYGTRNNHHNSIPFREFSDRFIASGAQRKNSPSS